MVFPILGGNSAVAGGYAIDNSLRFNSGDSPYLSQTLSTPTNRKIWTYSSWVKRSTLGASKVILAHNKVGNPNSTLRFNSTADTIRFFDVNASSTTVIDLITSQVFRDVSAFYHIVLSVDTTQATSSDRVKLYINGNQVTSFSTETYPSQNYDTTINSTEDVLEIGASNGTTNFDGYMAETYFIDGQQLSPTDFGEFDEDSGIWKPKQYSGSYGTNGFYLDFENSGSLGADQSGNGNNFTPTNLASTDQTTDTPTNNFATMNSLDKSGITLSEGNLKIFNNTGAHQSARGNFGMSLGKWYFECSISSVGTNQQQSFGLAKQNVTCPPLFTTNVFASVWGFTGANSYHYIYNNGSTTGATLVSVAVGDILKCAYDADSGKLWLGKNTNWFNINGGIDASANPATGTNPTMTLSETEPLVPYGHLYANSGTWNMFNFGQEGSFAGNKTAQGNTDGNGYGDFYYAPPSGYLALCTQNLATELSPTIDDGSQYFNTITYTANRTARSLTGVGFQPDWVWIKDRGGAQNHALFDSNRGVNKQLRSDTTGAELTAYSNTLTSFDSDGFSLGTDSNVGDVNYDLQSHVAWNWKANAGSTSSNTDGSITSTVQANTTSGFSILTWTGNGTASQSIGHGLGITPKIMIQKNRNQTEGWQIFGSTLFDRMQFDTGAEDANFPCTFSSSTITLPNLSNNKGFNSSGDNFVSYVFAEIEGYSKFGSYTGNGSTDGTFVYTGFRPSFLLIKRSDGVTNWATWDGKRDTFNEMFHMLQPNVTGLEITDANPHIDFTSNGFKFRTSWAGQNASGGTYIYMAFAENPFVTSTGIPVTAR